MPDSDFHARSNGEHQSEQEQCWSVTSISASLPRQKDIKGPPRWRGSLERPCRLFLVLRAFKSLSDSFGLFEAYETEEKTSHIHSRGYDYFFDTAPSKPRFVSPAQSVAFPFGSLTIKNSSWMEVSGSDGLCYLRLAGCLAAGRAVAYC